jgi:copper(I)-binding protein
VKTTAALVLLVASTSAFSCDGLEVTNAWIREAPPGADMLAGYAGLHNAGKESITLDGARSPDFGDVEMHRTSMENGKMRMRAEPQIVLEPDATVNFEPGGLHLMLMEPKRVLKAGDHVAIRLDCGKRSKAADFTVRADQ